MNPEPKVELSAAEQVARDLAEFLAHEEKPHGQWMPVPTGDGEGLIAGYEVLPHVQRFADAVRKATKVKSIGTYPGHSPSLERALDLFHAVNDSALAGAITDFFLANFAQFGGRYIIDRQRIWHRLDPVWRWMEDRGDNTQNHYDHNHISFEASAPEPKPEPPQPPKPVPVPEEDDDMKMIAVTEDRGIFLAGVIDPEDGMIPARHVGTPDEVTALVESGAVGAYDKRPALPASVFDVYYKVVG